MMSRDEIRPTETKQRTERTTDQPMTTTDNIRPRIEQKWLESWQTSLWIKLIGKGYFNGRDVSYGLLVLVVQEVELRGGVVFIFANKQVQQSWEIQSWSCYVYKIESDFGINLSVKIQGM
ncbi:uncharacterized protein LOC123200580 isoform X2 [Mangifera indica]|uniref:uncharacterized protein LOC123200580 isoform X2 n=1 Tax=Mangifera indica TaxID=29780 RepID=UPI001CFBA16D|nr:uncharacterized protein LOC123200580 isoform X2 [Mangifera indica]